MKHFFSKLMICLLFLSGGILKAACPTGQSEIIVHIVPDSWPQEISWDIRTQSGNIIASGTSTGDTLCIPTGSCHVFNIYDSYGDGIISPAGFWLYVDGVQVAQSSGAYTALAFPFNCPPGTYCSSPLALSYGNHVAQFDNSWYIFSPDSTGTYNITTCGLGNTCDTKIWIYSACNSNTLDEGPPGTYAYNDNAACALLADINVVFVAGNTYYIRIGDNMDNCSGNINFAFTYVGPISGCTDPAACNFNPMASNDDGSCIYYPNPLCAGPDLELDSLAFINSLSITSQTSTTCDVAEGCLLDYGTRWVVQFSSKINNIGTLDYYLGNPGANPTMFNFNNCHGHAHYEGYGDYRLFDMNGNMIPAGHKNGYCVMDLCGFGQYSCGNMGISVNCYDIYGAGTQCQWIDITDVPDGDYRLAAIINAYHLPDAMGHMEINHINNALQVCIHISHNPTTGVPSFTLLPNCQPYTDCLGIPGGTAIPDCAGNCNGSGIYGNVVPDTALNQQDVNEYMNMLLNNGNLTTCNDLSGNGSLTVYDAALAEWCIQNPASSNPNLNNPCSFPRNVTNPNNLTGLSISAGNYTQNYIDIEVMNVNADVKGYQFSVHGINISNVVSLANPSSFPVQIGFNPNTNQVVALSTNDSALYHQAAPQALCRIYFNQVTDTMICIDSIIDIAVKNGERAPTFVYGNCQIVNPLGISENASRGRITLQPNPSKGLIRLHLDNFSAQPSSLRVLDAVGRVAMLIPVPQTQQWFEADVSSLPGGVYTVEAIDQKGLRSVSRLVKVDQ
jgi:hypothetical protein